MENMNEKERHESCRMIKGEYWVLNTIVNIRHLPHQPKISIKVLVTIMLYNLPPAG